MNKKKLFFVITLALSTLTCTKKMEYNNPVDTNVKIMPPQDVNVILENDTLAFVSWVEPNKFTNNTEVFYLVESDIDVGVFSQIATFPSTTTEGYVKINLKTGREYKFRMRILSNNKYSEYSSPTSVTIKFIDPSNIKLSFIRDTAVYINWDYNGTYQLGFEVDRQINDSAFVNIANTTSIKRSIIDPCEIIVGNRYVYRIRAYSKNNLSNYVNSEYLTIIYPGPNNFLVNSIYGGKLRISWFKNINDKINSNDYELDIIVDDKLKDSIRFRALNTNYVVDYEVDFKKSYKLYLKSISQYNSSDSSNLQKLSASPLILGNLNNKIMTYKNSNWSELSSKVFSQQINKFINYNGRMILGGDSLLFLKEWDGSNWIEIGQCPYFGIVNDMIVFSDKLYICGNIYEMQNPMKQHSLVTYDGHKWSSEIFTLQDYEPKCFESYNNQLVLGLSNQIGNSVLYTYLADNWIKHSELPYPSYLEDIKTQNNILYVGGKFDSLGIFLKFNGHEWKSLGIGYTIIYYPDGTIMYRGNSEYYGGIAINNDKITIAYEFDNTPSGHYIEIDEFDGLTSVRKYYKSITMGQTPLCNHSIVDGDIFLAYRSTSYSPKTFIEIINKGTFEFTPIGDNRRIQISKMLVWQIF